MMTPALFFAISTSIAFAGDSGIGGWGSPVSISHDDQPCITYRAQVTSDGRLAVEVKLAPGWHTFTMDNDKRAAAKLGGKKALSSDKPTQIASEPSAGAGLEISGPWLQPQPKDFSQPDLRIFSWGYEGEALFAAPARIIAGTTAPRVRVKAQACTETVCKNIDLLVEAPVSKNTTAASLPNQAALIPVQ